MKQEELKALLDDAKRNAEGTHGMCAYDLSDEVHELRRAIELLIEALEGSLLIKD